MTVSSRGIALIFGALALVFSGAALAQENLDANKTPAQLYASDCVICHKSPRGLTRGGGVFGLESFLREHYTASRESAAAIAGYLRQVDRGPAPHPSRSATRPRHAPHGKSADKDKKAAEKNPAKPGDAKESFKRTGKKTGQAATDDKKAADKKDKKKDESKSAPKKPDGAKSAASKPAKPSKPKAMEAEAHTAKPATKPKDSKPAE